MNFKAYTIFKLTRLLIPGIGPVRKLPSNHLRKKKRIKMDQNMK
jgi:hypothetical protein